MKTALITETSKGIGLETALAFCRAGYKVFATMRCDAKYKNGNTYDAQVAHLWTLKDGKVTAFQQYVDTKKLNDALNN